MSHLGEAFHAEGVFEYAFSHLYLCVRVAPDCSCDCGHGSASSTVRRPLGAHHGVGLWHGPLRTLPHLHCLPHHHLEKEPHEVRPTLKGRRLQGVAACREERKGGPVNRLAIRKVEASQKHL